MTLDYKRQCKNKGFDICSSVIFVLKIINIITVCYFVILTSFLFYALGAWFNL